MPPTARVAIFGGGIAGLTVAHELALRDFEVHLYERGALDELGGKARTQYWNASGIGRLPGEHGFRFFPRFYSHVHDTMARIPLDSHAGNPGPTAPPAGRTVLDQLVDVPVDGIGRRGESVINMPRRWSPSGKYLLDAIGFLFKGLDVPPRDQVRIGARLMRYFVAGDKRRLGEYERVSFWDFIEADALSPDGQEMILNMPKVFVAMNAREGNARTLGNVLFLMLRDMLRPASEADGILAGPTSETWLLPWRDWLGALGVQIHPNSTLESVDCDAGARHIRSARLAGGATVNADHYVVAIPLEAAQQVVRPNAALRQFAELDALASINENAALGWMVGAQFYLRRNVRTPQGHLGWADCRWALTGVSQAQFWAPDDFSTHYGQGKIDGIMSLNVSDWQQAGVENKKKAIDCTRHELYLEILAQTGALIDGQPILSDANVAAWRFDDDLTFDTNAPDAHVTGNRSPLLIHPPKLWSERPAPGTAIDNLFLAADYVRNDMDLATMEGANQAARDAVNALLDRTGSTKARCRSGSHLADNEWEWLKTAKALDDLLYDQGMKQGEAAPPGGVGTLSVPSVEGADADTGWAALEAFERAMRDGK
jgi:uncharacterized protein with NAD-binding domain and iron-sulfur cluster